MAYLQKLKLFKQYFAREDGSTAIEFSMLCIPFITVMLAIIEISVMYASATLLEGATNSAARLVRTGQVQKAGGDAEEMFRDALCGYTTVLVNCNDVQIEVVTMDSFASFDSYSASFDEDGNLVSQGFDAGGSEDRVLIRAVYRYRMMTPFIGQLLVGDDGEQLFISTIVLQTEPYEFQGDET